MTLINCHTLLLALTMIHNIYVCLHSGHVKANICHDICTYVCKIRLSPSVILCFMLPPINDPFIYMDYCFVTWVWSIVCMWVFILVMQNIHLFRIYNFHHVSYFVLSINLKWQMTPQCLLRCNVSMDHNYVCKSSWWPCQSRYVIQSTHLYFTVHRNLVCARDLKWHLSLHCHITQQTSPMSSSTLIYLYSNRQ